MSLARPHLRSLGAGALALALCLGGPAGCGGAGEVERAAAPTPSWRAAIDGWAWPQPIPSVPLVDQDGRGFRLGELADRYLLLGFIFTRCTVAKACPMTTARMARALELWEGRPAEGRPPLHLLSLTLDPGWDTPERLKVFAQAHGARLDRWTFATGPAELMTDGLPSLFNVLALPSAELGLSHTVKVVLLRPGLTEIAQWKDDAFDPEEVGRRILADVEASSSGPGEP